MKIYRVRQFHAGGELLRVEVPASKSILNRALLLAAFTEGDTRLRCGAYADDTNVLIGCLNALGIATEQEDGGIIVHGKAKLPVTNAELYVGGAGTVARFLTTVLAFRGGSYLLRANEQMEKRPMDIIKVLAGAGVRFEFLDKEGHFPFRMHSDGITAQSLFIGTDVSTQYASGILLAAALGNEPFMLRLAGTRVASSYIRMTAKLIETFGATCTRSAGDYSVLPIRSAPSEVEIEPDLSAACYFYALSLLCGARVLVRGVHLETSQGDAAFLKMLSQKGVHITDTPEGVVADGKHLPFYNGIDEDLHDFSDQTMTVAALALFATTPSILRNVAHIRNQECDRIQAIVDNANALGARAFTNGNDIFIEPMPLHGGVVKTYGDHRIAMAFALVGLKTGNIEIEDPDCCKKTFDNYFEILDKITE